MHGIPADEVHFHEVGALDSIADVVGVLRRAARPRDRHGSAAGAVAVGSGRVSTAHGDLPVPVPAVAELAHGWRVQAGGAGELTTPTGMALVAALCETLRGPAADDRGWPSAPGPAPGTPPAGPT